MRIFVSPNHLWYGSPPTSHCHGQGLRRRIMSTNIVAGCLTLFLALTDTTLYAQGIFEGMFDKAKKSTEQKASDRFNQRIDETIDKGMNKTEQAVQCVATDQECLKRAKDEGKAVSVVNAPTPPSDSVKCVATDTGCLKQAKAQGKKVEIVDEADLDTFRCAVTDGDCLKRAK